jgi:hypothetical protein
LATAPHTITNVWDKESADDDVVSGSPLYDSPRNTEL